MYKKGRTTDKVIKYNKDLHARLEKRKNLKKRWKNLNYDFIQDRMIYSIKASVRRNLEGFNLCPGLNSE